MKPVSYTHLDVYKRQVVSFTRHADDRRSHHISGLAYSAGVLLSLIHI